MIDAHKVNTINNNLTEIFDYPLLKVHWKISPVKDQFFFNTPVPYFLKKAIPHSIAIFFTYYAYTAFNWVVSVTKKNLRITGFFASILFLTYLLNKRLYD